jgi:hypothetical protein
MPRFTNVQKFRHTLHESRRVSATSSSATGLLHFTSYYIEADRLQYHSAAFLHRLQALQHSAILSDSIALRLRHCPLIELPVMADSDFDEDALFEKWNRQLC